MEALTIIELNQLYAAGKFEELAKHPGIYLEPEWAMGLTLNESDFVRETLALNEALAELPDVAMKLANDAKYWVRRYLAINPAIAKLPKLAKKIAKKIEAIFESEIPGLGFSHSR